jgi:hypothetical protein
MIALYISVNSNQEFGDEVNEFSSLRIMLFLIKMPLII